MQIQQKPKRKEGGEGGGIGQTSGTSPRGTTATSGKKRRGAPPGNRRAFKHGRYAKDNLAMFKEIAAWKKTTQALIMLGEKQLALREGREPRKRIRLR